ncbi:carboxymuconolactone decarboxylase family protein [Elioraea sp.]|uniref:carboxymuconolactone decarboxylase family protein n=1 Tax=Elioraea sp. TaxID=2185103 RepID=UPI0025C0C401|nr:alkylhydroperoxidase [Elioraea sp.]
MTDATNPAWIRLVPYGESTGYLRMLYDRVKGPDDRVDNVMRAHSLRPHTMEGHSALYKSVLHHADNVTPVWFLEALGVYTSLANACDYSVAHHYAGLCRLVGEERGRVIFAALSAARPEDAFAGKELALLRYVRKLTLTPQAMEAADIATLRSAGAEDGEILEANQVSAYFNYSNRLLNGLGVTTAGDVLGLSPPNTKTLDDWEHA